MSAIKDHYDLVMTESTAPIVQATPPKIIIMVKHQSKAGYPVIIKTLNSCMALLYPRWRRLKRKQIEEVHAVVDPKVNLNEHLLINRLLRLLE